MNRLSHKTMSPPITLREAKDQGYMPLTIGYDTTNAMEYWMMDRVIIDLENGNIDYELVMEEAEKPFLLSIYRERPAHLVGLALPVEQEE